MPALIEEMMKRGMARRKDGQRILQARKEGRRIGNSDARLAQRWSTARGRKRSSVRSKREKPIEDTRERLRALVAPALEGKGGDKASRFLWASLSEMCLYAARRMPEIANTHRRRGSRHAVGIRLGTGPVRSVGRDRRRADGAGARARREADAAAGEQGAGDAGEIVLRKRKGHDALLRSGHRRARKPVPEQPGVIILKSLKERTPVVQKNAGASLIDLGDGVVCCEFHSKMNAIGGGYRGDDSTPASRGSERISRPW